MAALRSDSSPNDGRYNNLVVGQTWRNFVKDNSWRCETIKRLKLLHSTTTTTRQVQLLLRCRVMMIARHCDSTKFRRCMPNHQANPLAAHSSRIGAMGSIIMRRSGMSSGIGRFVRQASGRVQWAQLYFPQRRRKQVVLIKNSAAPHLKLVTIWAPHNSRELFTKIAAGQ